MREIINRISSKRKESDRYAWTEFRDLGGRIRGERYGSNEFTDKDQKNIEVET